MMRFKSNDPPFGQGGLGYKPRYNQRFITGGMLRNDTLVKYQEAMNIPDTDLDEAELILKNEIIDYHNPIKTPDQKDLEVGARFSSLGTPEEEKKKEQLRRLLRYGQLRQNKRLGIVPFAKPTLVHKTTQEIFDDIKDGVDFDIVFPDYKIIKNQNGNYLIALKNGKNNNLLKKGFHGKTKRGIAHLKTEQKQILINLAKLIFPEKQIKTITPKINTFNNPIQTISNLLKIPIDNKLLTPTDLHNLITKSNLAHGEAFEQVIDPMQIIKSQRKKLLKNPKGVTLIYPFHNSKTLGDINIDYKIREGRKGREGGIPVKPEIQETNIGLLYGIKIKLGGEIVPLANACVFDFFNRFYEVEYKNWNTNAFGVNYTTKQIKSQKYGKPDIDNNFPIVNGISYGIIQESKLVGNYTFRPYYYCVDESKIGEERKYKLYNIDCKHRRGGKIIGWLYGEQNVDRDVYAFFNFKDGVYAYKINETPTTTSQYSFRDVSAEKTVFDKKGKGIPLYDIATLNRVDNIGFPSNEGKYENYALLDYSKFIKCDIKT